VASIPAIHELGEKLKARGLRTIAVTEVDPDDFDEDKANVEAAAKKHHLEQPCLLDKNGAWMKSALIEGLPTFLLIGRDGKLAYRYRGTVKQGSPEAAELTAAVEKLLGPG
jgi:hypothetical protein